MQLSKLLDIIPARLVRDGDFDSLGFVSHDAEDMLTFLEDARFLPKLLQNPNVTCVITSKDLLGSLPPEWGAAIAPNPRKAFYSFHNYLHQEIEFYWQNTNTRIAADARIHASAHVAERNVQIGRRVIIEPNVTVLERSVIGDEAIIRAGSTIGSQGFEFKRFDNEVFAVAHAGGVLINDRVEVQANCALSRSVFGGFTELGEDTKLDNLVHIAHNVQIGRRCFLAACAMIAGSVTIGDDVWIGPGASVSSEVRIGDGAQITLGSVVTRDVAPGQRVTGNFAIEHDKFIAFLKSIR